MPSEGGSAGPSVVTAGRLALPYFNAGAKIMEVGHKQMSSLIKVEEAAQIIGCTTGRVRQLLLAGELHGCKITGNSWVLVRQDAERYARHNPRTVGRKRVSDPTRKIQDS